MDQASNQNLNQSGKYSAATTAAAQWWQANAIWVGLTLLLLIMVGGFIYMSRQISALRTELSDAKTAQSTALASTTAAFDAKVTVLSQGLTDLGGKTSNLSQTLSATQQDILAANTNITEVKNKVGGVEQSVGSIAGTVSNLQKLATVDEELLKKYSKVYFLNENYTPAHIMTLPQSYVYSNTIPEEFLTEAWPHLQRMLDAAKANGTPIYVRSGYRSFGEQEKLKSNYKVTYGEGTANTFSADQGYSEHQLGATVDLVTAGQKGELSEAFDTTEAFRWLQKNAYKYGFVMSYPKGNAYYVYEPWHWRFVGVALATYMYNRGANFYDLDQREIDKYMVNLFD